MLDDNPVLKERLMAFGAFAGIALFAVAAVDVMVTGGFDFGPGRAPYNREQPSAYVRMVDAANYVGDSIRSMGWDEAFARAPDTSASEERLAGEDDGTATQVNNTDVDGGDNLYAEIAALYQQSEDTYVEGPAYDDAPAIDAETADQTADDQEWEAQPLEDDSAEAEKVASAYETGSPW